MKIIIVVILSSLLISCSHLSPIYWGWGEWGEADVAGVENNSLVRIDWSTLPGVVTSIDGNKVGSGYKKAKLHPGKHLIEYAYYPAEFGVHPKGSVELDFKSGHWYQFEIKLCYWCRPRKFAAWLHDKTTGEVVWGKPPDWHFL
ncbi:hypothetical protein KOM00_03580 [Geomonas sp. Red69]|uniref:PEGA domain-containing protein n=1 Tax=Geomonas diazotrophica TaxID=2843197 RepID=A0ABX8JK15_9BACT|nr:MULTISPECIES: hypothetical protein [Geomonas]MBU5635805.1 hypothetical protein [Geomonas diazotrophica]QWV97964.1 hypothetical protein KP005_01310 [Geomonas nitrogeniifigens]QXE87095.1 hypothetical protein KP003_01410 [Geomonas nitrogeniifigens]